MSLRNKIAVVLAISLAGSLSLLVAGCVPNSSQALPTRVSFPPQEATATLNPTAVVDASTSENADDTPHTTSAAAPIPADEDDEIPQPTRSPDSAATPVTIQPPEMPENITIQFNRAASPQEKQDYIQSVGGDIVDEIEPLGRTVIRVARPDIALPPSPIVQSAEPDYYVTAFYNAPTTDTFFADQWALTSINIDAAWDTLPQQSPTTIIAVIDSGICFDHVDLAGRILTNGRDFVEQDNLPQDEFGHGCGVAGIIAANIDNGEGIAGLAGHTQILPLRVLDESGIGTYSDVAGAIVYAADNGAEIINLSLGGVNKSAVLEDAIQYATSQGLTIVAAAGNSGQEGVYYPAAYAGVIAVGALDESDQRSSFSSYGAEIAKMAPGSNIITTSLNNSYQTQSGTSFAAPHVAAALAIHKLLGTTLALDGSALSFTSDENSTTAPPPSSRTPSPTATGTPKPTSVAPIAPPPATGTPIPTRTPALPPARPNDDPLFRTSSALQAANVSDIPGALRARTVEINFGALSAATTAFDNNQTSSGRTLTLNFFDDVTIIANNEIIEDRPLDAPGYIWRGRVAGEPESDVVIVVTQNFIVGQVSRPGRMYRVEAINGSVHGIYEIDPDQMPGTRAVPFSSSSSLSSSSLSSSPDDNAGDLSAPQDSEASAQVNDTGAYIDVYVLYTANARLDAGGIANIEAEINTAISFANQSYQYSAVNQRLNLVGMRETPYVEAADMLDDLFRLDNPNDNYMDEAHILRDDYGADLIALVTGETNGACGIAYQPSTVSVANDGSGFSVTARDCFGGYTFAHELGHNMGSAHNVEDSGSQGAYEYSYGYRDDPNDFRTIMAYACPGYCPRINRWSNPDQTYNGFPGGATFADNSRSLNNTAIYIANYRLSVPAKPTNFQVAEAGAYSIDFSWTDTSTNEDGFFIDYWNGSNWIIEANLPAGTTSYTANGLACGRNTYYYGIRSYRYDSRNNLIVDSLTPDDGFYDYIAATTRNCPPSQDNIQQAVVISSLPYTDTQSEIELTTISGNDPAMCASSGTSNTVWYTYTPNIDHEIIVDTFGSDYDTVVSIYTGSPDSLTQVVCNDDAGSTLQAEVSWFANQAVRYYILVAHSGSTALSSSATLSLNADYGIPPNNDATTARPVDSLPYSNMQITYGTTTNDTTTPTCGINPDRSIWYRFTPAESARYGLDTIGSDYDTVLSIRDDSNGVPGSELSCNNDYASGETSRIVIDLYAANTYWIQISGNEGAAGIAQFNVESLAFESCDTVNDISQAECTHLLALYDQTNGSAWTTQSRWFFDKNMCSWMGITCQNNSVTGLSLPSNNVSGTLPSALYELRQLKSLDLQDNPISGFLDARVANWTHLQTLNLSQTRLGLRLPAEIGRLTTLNTLDLSYSAFVGSIPVSITNLTALDPAASSIAYNALQSSDPAVTTFLNDKFSGWHLSQTRPVADLAVNTATQNSLTLSWTPIDYISDGGYYEIGIASPTQQEQIIGQTTDKTANNFVINGLNPATTYTICVYTYTPAHDNQQNDLRSLCAAAQGTTANPPPTSAPPPGQSTIGIFNNGTWAFRNANNGGTADTRFTFGLVQEGWTAITGDWNGDGTDGIGVYKDGLFYLRDTTNSGIVDYTILMNSATGTGWQPVAGDWNGDRRDTVGVYKDGLWLLMNDLNKQGTVAIRIQFQPFAQDGKVIAGDWTNDGFDSIGLYQNGLFVLRDTTQRNSAVQRVQFGSPQAGWIPLAGDWNQNGTDTIGVYKDGTWRLRYTNTSGAADQTFVFWQPGQPVANYRGSSTRLSLLASASTGLIATITPTQTATASPVASNTTTASPTATATPVASNTPTAAPTATDTATATQTATHTATPVPTSTPTATSTAMPTATATTASSSE